jgi:hypothetical protein
MPHVIKARLPQQQMVGGTLRGIRLPDLHDLFLETLASLSPERARKRMENLFRDNDARPLFAQNPVGVAMNKPACIHNFAAYSR